MRAALNDAARVKEMEGKVGTLQVECDRLRNKIRNREEQIRNANARAQASARAITEVKEALSISADVVNKVRLFDARLEKEDHLSKSRIIRFLVEQAHQMEETADRMRLLVDSVGPATPRPHPDQTHPEIWNPEATSPPEGGIPEDRSKSRKRKMVATASSYSSGDPVADPSSIPRISDDPEWANLVVPMEEEIARADRASGEKTTPVQFRIPEGLMSPPDLHLDRPSWIAENPLTTRILRSAGSPGSSHTSPVSLRTPETGLALVQVLPLTPTISPHEAAPGSSS
jgi:hypothetical protein